MKLCRTALIILVCFYGMCHEYLYSQVLNFQPLRETETLMVDIQKDVGRLKKLKIYKYGVDKQAVFEYSGFSFSFKEANQSKDKKWVSFSVAVQHGDEHSPIIVEIWLINGTNGKIIKLFTSVNLTYAIDSEARTICIYDDHESADIPILNVFQISDMKLLKTEKVYDLKGKNTYPKIISYTNGKYTIELINDGMDYKKIEIPIK